MENNTFTITCNNLVQTEDGAKMTCTITNQAEDLYMAVDTGTEGVYQEPPKVDERDYIEVKNEEEKEENMYMTAEQVQQQQPPGIIQSDLSRDKTVPPVPAGPRPAGPRPAALPSSSVPAALPSSSVPATVPASGNVAKTLAKGAVNAVSRVLRKANPKKGSAATNVATTGAGRGLKNKIQNSKKRKRSSKRSNKRTNKRTRKHKK